MIFQEAEGTAMAGLTSSFPEVCRRALAKCPGSPIPEPALPCSFYRLSSQPAVLGPAPFTGIR